MVDTTIEYYNYNADVFFKETLNVDMTRVYNRYLKHIKLGGKILDAGCGSGRDSHYFINKGYSVTAFDASVEMAKRSSQLIGQAVQQMTFEDADFDEQFDGIWACASLLHVRRNNIEDVIRKLARNLVDNGVYYMSFKYGDREYEKDGRYFNCYDEASIEKLVEGIPDLVIKEVFKTTDARPRREEEYWLNVVILKKTTTA